MNTVRTEAVSEQDARDAAAQLATIAANLEMVLRGKPEVVALSVICLLAEGHLLIEDVPGTGKTSLARAIARTIDASTHRIQFTPDLLPSDVTGVTVYNQADQAFEFHPGGVFANVVVADELNRASPKTQAALLEVMEERVVTVDAIAHEVPRPFVVVATQNPIDLEGTYRLPEAQLDRFLLTTAIGYPDRETEIGIGAGESAAPALAELGPVSSADQMRSLIAMASQVYVAPGLVGYIVDLAAGTRDHPDVRLGLSTRSVVLMVRATRARALLSGRNFVTPEDVKALAVPVFAHRLILTPEAELQGLGQAALIERLLDSQPVPGGAEG